MKKFIITISLFISIISSCLGQEINLTSAFDTTSIYIGDQIKFTITIDQPSDLRLSIPFFKDTLIKNIEIISGPVIDSTMKNGRTKIVEKYLITSFDSGFYQVRPVFAELKNENGLKRFYSDYSQLRVLRVNTAPADTTAKIYDIINPYRAPVTIDEILPWVLLVILIVALVWLAIKYLPRLRKTKEEMETEPNPDPAHIIAFRELEKLKEEQLWQKGELKNYYTKLTEILRQYLENRFKVFSLELTTAETLDALVKTGFKRDASYTQLKAILTGADLVKFAKYNPEPLENDSHFQNSWDFILSTKENDVIVTDSTEKDKAREGSI
jgi:hypothetical protein